MEQINRLPVTVTMAKKHWDTIINIIEPIYLKQGKDWLQWGNYVKQTIQASSQKVVSPDGSVSVTLPEDGWKTINSYIEVNCRTRSKEWVVWAGNIIQIVEKAIEAKIEDQKQASTHANTLQQNPNDFRAQMVRIDAALKYLNIKKLGVDDFLTDEYSGSTEVDLFLSALKGVSSLSKAAKAASTQKNYKNELLRLAQIFRNICQTNTDVDEFLYMAETMISLGDFIKDVPIASGRPNLYIEVVNALIEKLEMTGRESDIKAVQDKAESRLMLFKA
jgi:hypothetical protein